MLQKIYEIVPISLWYTFICKNNIFSLFLEPKQDFCYYLITLVKRNIICTRFETIYCFCKIIIFYTKIFILIGFVPRYMMNTIFCSVVEYMYVHASATFKSWMCLLLFSPILHISYFTCSLYITRYPSSVE